MLQPWMVCSPEYGTVIPVTDEGQGPTEYGCDVVFVEAETRRDALLFGVALLKQQGARYLDDAENPYAGVTVEPQTCAIHGLTAIVWTRDGYDCTACGEVG